MLASKLTGVCEAPAPRNAATEQENEETSKVANDNLFFSL